MKQRLLILLLIIACALGVHAQTHTRVYDEQIRTLRVEREALILGEEASLHISFDQMSHDVHFYTYTVSMLHSDLISNEYLQGFTTMDITEYEHSINTSREYTHYWFHFPNEDMQLTKSGQYCLSIYEDGDPERVVAEVDFCVVEPLVKVEATIRANTDIEFNGRYQQVDIDVLTSALNVRDPNEITLVVTQNNRLDNAVTLHQPTYVEPTRLRYTNNRNLIFEGGNEYHHFDAFSCFYSGTGIDRVFHEMGDYHAFLFPSEVLTGQYIHEFDSNGRFIVNAERTTDVDIEAEYMWVYWTIPVDQPWLDKSIYVGGELFGNELSIRNRMQYDADNKLYWLTSLVKQGGYDFQYWSKGKEGGVTVERIDGTYWQTENEYAIYVYWRPFGARYDRLVGLLIQKSTL